MVESVFLLMTNWGGYLSGLLRVPPTMMREPSFEAPISAIKQPTAKKENVVLSQALQNVTFLEGSHFSSSFG